MKATVSSFLTRRVLAEWKCESRLPAAVCKRGNHVTRWRPASRSEFEKCRKIQGGQANATDSANSSFQMRIARNRAAHGPGKAESVCGMVPLSGKCFTSRVALGGGFSACGDGPLLFTYHSLLLAGKGRGSLLNEFQRVATLAPWCDQLSLSIAVASLRGH